MDLLSKFKSVLPVTYNVRTDNKKQNERAIIEIPIHAVKPSPYQPRRTFDRDTIEELSLSIKKYGVIQPVTVRKLPDNTYELIAGERRLRACTLCGMLKIPAIVIDLNDNDSAVVALVENIQRENLSFMEEAEAYRNLLYHHGFTQEELAKKLGKTQATVANKIRLLKLPSIVREIIKDYNLTERHARALLRLKTREEQLEALEKITSSHLNVHQSEELIENMVNPKSDPDESDVCESAIPEPTPPVMRAKPKLISKKSLRDVRIFINTFRHAISLMQKNGIAAESTEEEFDDYYEYTVKIPKNNENNAVGKTV